MTRSMMLHVTKSPRYFEGPILPLASIDRRRRSRGPDYAALQYTLLPPPSPGALATRSASGFAQAAPASRAPWLEHRLRGSPRPFACRSPSSDRLVTGFSPFAADCGDRTAPPTSNAEVEPHIAINPAEPRTTWSPSWQQDRWSNGSARGLMSRRLLRRRRDLDARQRRSPLHRRSAPTAATTCARPIPGSLSLPTAPPTRHGPHHDRRHVRRGRQRDAGRALHRRRPHLVRPVTSIRDGAGLFNDKNRSPPTPRRALRLRGVGPPAPAGGERARPLSRAPRMAAPPGSRRARSTIRRHNADHRQSDSRAAERHAAEPLHAIAARQSAPYPRPCA